MGYYHVLSTFDQYYNLPVEKVVSYEHGMVFSTVKPLVGFVTAEMAQAYIFEQEEQQKPKPEIVQGTSEMPITDLETGKQINQGTTENIASADNNAREINIINISEEKKEEVKQEYDPVFLCLINSID